MKESTTIIRQFRSAIRRGTGETHLLMKEYPEVDFSKEIIKASLFNYAYDGQCENSRAPYLFELIELSQKKDIIRKPILEALVSEEDDTWTLTQLFDLALQYAKQGDENAYKAIYNRFNVNVIDYSSWTGGAEIIELDGLKGLLFIADEVGSCLKRDNEKSEDDFLIRYCQDLHLDINVYSELENDAKKNANIRCYIDNVRETMLRWNKIKVKIDSFTNVIEEIEQKSFFSLKNRKLSDEEIRQIANRFIDEKDSSSKAKFLCVFDEVKYPYDYETILKLAKQRADKYRLQEYALDALKHIQSDEIREFALNKLETSRHPALYTSILLSNYKEGDEKLLSQIARKFNNEYIVESLVSSYIDIYENNKTPRSQLPLEVLYYKSNCGICRYSIVQILLENNVLSDKIKEEIQFDSNKDIRDLY